MPIHRAVATASGFGVLIAVPSVLGFLLLPVADAPPYTVGAVNLPAFLVVIGTTLLTTPLGVRLAHAMNPKPLKRAFAVFLTLVALEHAAQGPGMVGAGLAARSARTRRSPPGPTLPAVPPSTSLPPATEPWRCGGTWFVGVDALPNSPDGAINGTPFPWAALPLTPEPLHTAQLSVIRPGYPQPSPEETPAAFAFRRDRDAAHLDGLLPIGPDKAPHGQGTPRLDPGPAPERRPPPPP